MRIVKIFIGGTTPFADNRGNAAIFRGLIEFFYSIASSDYGKNTKFILYIWHTYPESIIRPIMGTMTTRLELKSKNLLLYVLYDRSSLFKHGSILYLVYFTKMFYRVTLSLLLTLLRMINVDIRNVPDIVVRMIKNADLVIEVNYGDTFSDYYKKHVLVSNIIRMLIYLLFHKKVVMFPQYLGPFKSRPSKLIAKLLLDKADIILVRDPISMLNVKKLNLRKPKIFLVPDLGFLAPISSSAKISQAKEFINREHCEFALCFVPNLILLSKIELLKEFISALVEMRKLVNVCLVLIPHGSSSINKIDEKTVCNIIEKVALRLSVKAISLADEFNVEDLWSTISMCTVLVSLPMHPAIPAARLGVPFFVISDKEKVYGLAKLIGVEKEHIIQPSNFAKDVFLEKLSRVLRDYDFIKSHLIARSRGLETITLRRLSEILKSLIDVS